MPETASSTKRASRPSRDVGADEARAKVLAKLTKAGPKGVASLHPAAISEVARATYAAVLVALEAAGEVFVDRRKPKPKYYAAAARPEFPSAESVAAELVEFAGTRFPVLAATADLKKQLGKDGAKKMVFAAALQSLVEQGQLVELLIRSGKKNTATYVSAEKLREALARDTVETRPFPEAYATVVRRTGFPAIMLAELQRESRADLPALHRWLFVEHRAGRAVLSLGDWSLASDAERAAALEMHGERYLQVRLLS